MPRTTEEGLFVIAAGVESGRKRSSETWLSSTFPSPSPCRDGVVNGVKDVREFGGGDNAVTDRNGNGVAIVAGVAAVAAVVAAVAAVVAAVADVKAFIVFFHQEEALSRRRRGP